MSFHFSDLQRYMVRRIFVVLMLLAVGCTAQMPPQAEVNRRVERQVRSMLDAPSDVKIEVGDRQPSKEFTGLDELTVTLSKDEHSQKVHFFITKDSQTMY